MEETKRATTAEEITARALASFDGCENERLWTVMTALVRHLHEFAREVQRACGVVARRAVAAILP